MQKLINAPANAASESLEGFALAWPHLLRVHFDPDFACRRDAPVQGKVAVISGSGSGHEPLQVGYVGYGMLDAACPGAVFTSPTPDQYLAAMQAVYGGAGALFVVKNFMGGVLNTSLALEFACQQGYQVESVLVHDDVALEQRDNRRGLGGAILVEKIAGAAAEAGWNLAQVTAVTRRASERTRSMAVAVSSCTTPEVGHPTFDLPPAQMELGVGIHGEPGRQRMSLASADATAELLVEPIVCDLPLRAGDPVLALVSGLGATPQQELYIIFRHVHAYLTAHGIRVERQLVGNYVTSLDMAGCMVTLLQLDSELLALWDAPVRTPTLNW